MQVGPAAFMGLAAVLFSLGLYGVVARKSAVMVLMSLQLMAAAVSLNMVATSRFVTPTEMTGQLFAIFAMVVAVAGIGLGLALALAVHRQTDSIELSGTDSSTRAV